MTTNFTSFNYLATGGSTARKDPDRWMDVINVKEFGAVGNGSTDDTTAINNAIAHSGTANIGEIYFPPGTYKVTSAINITPLSGNQTIVIRGAGAASVITGSVADFLLKSVTGIGPLIIIENIYINNSNAAGGGIRIDGASTCTISNVYTNAYIGVDISKNNSSVIVFSLGCIGLSGWPAGGIGLLLGGNTAAYQVDAIACETGISACHGAAGIFGFRCERNKTGLRLGQSVTYNGGALNNQTLVDDQLSASTILNGTMEGNDTGIYAYDVGGSCLIAGINISGSLLSPSSGSIYGINLRNFSNSMIANAGVSGSDSTSFTTAGVNITNAGQSTLMNIGSSTFAGSAGQAWVLPASTMPIFVNCNQPSQAVTYANRPTSPSVGWTAWISDSNTATFRATISGSGGNTVLGLYNGTNWVVAG